MTLATWLAYYVGCIGTRLALTLTAQNASQHVVRAMGYAALLPAVGFTVIYACGLRNTTGWETFGGKIWWNSLRPLHATLYATFAFLAISRRTWAWVPLFADLLVALVAPTYLKRAT